MLLTTQIPKLTIPVAQSPMAVLLLFQFSEYPRIVQYLILLMTPELPCANFLADSALRTISLLPAFLGVHQEVIAFFAQWVMHSTYALFGAKMFTNTGRNSMPP